MSLHQPEEFGKGQNETPHVQPPPRILLSGILLGWTRRAPPGRTLELEWLAKDNPETNPMTINPETASHVTEQFSWVPRPSRSPPRRSFPVKSLALSAHVSPWTIHLWVLDKSPVSGPGRGPPSCNIPMQVMGSAWEIIVPFRTCVTPAQTPSAEGSSSKKQHMKVLLNWLLLKFLCGGRSDTGGTPGAFASPPGAPWPPCGRAWGRGCALL